MTKSQKTAQFLIQGFTLNHKDFTPFIGLNTKTIRVNTLIYALFVSAFHFTFASSFFSTLSCSLVLALMQCSQVQHHNPTFHPFDTNSSRSQQDNFQDDMCPADFVCFYLTDAVFHNMVIETNCYAHQLITKKKTNRMLKPKSCLRKRKPTDLKEMEVWFSPDWSRRDPMQIIRLLIVCCTPQPSAGSCHMTISCYSSPAGTSMTTKLLVMTHRQKKVFIPPQWLTVCRWVTDPVLWVLALQTVNSKQVYPSGCENVPTMYPYWYHAWIQDLHHRKNPYNDINAGVDFLSSKQIILNLAELYLSKGYKIRGNWPRKPQFFFFWKIEKRRA